MNIIHDHDGKSSNSLDDMSRPIPVPSSMPHRSSPVPPPPHPNASALTQPSEPATPAQPLIPPPHNSPVSTHLPKVPSIKTPTSEQKKTVSDEKYSSESESDSTTPPSQKNESVSRGSKVTAPKSNRTIVAVLVAAIVVAFGVGGVWFYQENIRKAEEQARIAKQEEERKKLAEEEQKKKAEEVQKAKAEAEARALAEAREKAEQEERTKQELVERMRQMEEQSAQLARQQQELQRRQQQIEQQRTAAPAPSKNTPPASSGTVVTLPRMDQNSGATQGTAASNPALLDPRTKCAKKDNFISKSLCESKACQKPEYSSHPYCESFRQKVGGQNN